MTHSMTERQIDIESERRAFQDWYEAHMYPLEHSNWFAADPDGDYLLDEVATAWSAWSERASRALAEQARDHKEGQ